MKNKWLVILAFILSGISLFAILRNKNTTLRKNESQVGFADPEKISSFTLSAAGKTLRFERLDQQWFLNDSFPVKPGLAGTFIKTLSTLQVKAPLSRKQGIGLADSVRQAGVEVSFYNGKSCVRTYSLRSRAGNPGTILLPKGSSRLVLVEIPGFSGEPAHILRMNEDYWKDQVILNLPLSQMASLMVREAGTGNGFLLFRTGADKEWQVTGYPDSLHTSPVDPIVLGDLLRNLGRVPYLQCIADNNTSAADSIGQLQPGYLIRTCRFDGKTEQLLIYPRPMPAGKNRKVATDPDLAWAWLENSRQLVLVKYTDLDNFLLNSEDLTKH
ncbi:MAG: hypothetical protein U0T82_15420 [Bacteroidales bacterium]